MKCDVMCVCLEGEMLLEVERESSAAATTTAAVGTAAAAVCCTCTQTASKRQQAEHCNLSRTPYHLLITSISSCLPLPPSFYREHLSDRLYDHLNPGHPASPGSRSTRTQTSARVPKWHPYTDCSTFNSRVISKSARLLAHFDRQ